MDLLRIEQQRQALEANLQQLRQSLKYWQTFEAEYEGLKEEINESQPLLDLGRLCETYDGQLVNHSVIRELAGLDKDTPRTGPQVIRDVERRQEYVRKNIETIQRRFFDAEAKLEEFDFAAMRDGGPGGGVGGLPLTEIHEELDEEGNVISASLSQPEAAQAKLVESLRKAGLTQGDLEVEEGSEEKEQVPLKPAITNSSVPNTPGPIAMPSKRHSVSIGELSGTAGEAIEGGNPALERPQIRKKSVSFTVDTKEAPEMVRLDSEDGKKSVSFNDKIAVAPAAPLPDSRSVQFSPQVEEIPAQPLGPPSPALPAAAKESTSMRSDAQKDLRASFKPGDIVKTLGDDDQVVTEEVVLPDNEDDEDAQTRREMLDYHLNEVGHVVAQMDLDGTDDYNDDDFADEDDETSSHFTGSSYPGDEDTPYTSGLSDDDEDEDEYGRTQGKVVTDDYRKRMLEMQERLIGNLGPAPQGTEGSEVDAEIDPSDARRLVVRNKRSSMSSENSDDGEKKASGKKRVSFAEALDVAEESGSLPPSKALKPLDEKNEMVAPVADTIAEKAVTAPQAAPGAAAAKPAHTSRFKKTRTPATQPTTATPPNPHMSIHEHEPTNFDSPTGPANRTLAETLIERPSASPHTTTKPPSFDDEDPIASRRQLAAEYYRRRNEMIRQQGGFSKSPREEEEEESLGELMEDRGDGKVRRVSRFRAARIGG
ncbi:hypothetical protein B0A50_08819 [Salinomyces thailandicus]|uniref:DUF3835 domain-containing protein n=1 Tax=Salinomyces thailandicus TaxID=706561 RepID=A0A4U0TIN4_9PEZI|nr:hypothetical protein B0A50_08819 [Salinomyces thailandica]